MTSQQVLQSDLLDILFEQRNKTYGAYQLRKSYQGQLVKALTTAVGSAFILLLLFHPAHSKPVAGDDRGKVVVVRTVNLPPEQKKPGLPKPPGAPKTEVRQQVFVDNVHIIPKEVVDPLPPQDALTEVAISDRTANGKEVGTVQPPLEPEGNGAGNTEMKTEPEPTAKEAVPDKQPQFPGGMAAWMRFLQNNLTAPEELPSGERRVVLIRFHVAEDGSITNFQVLQSAGSAFDNEVIQVLKKMPKWTPALKAGQPVSVSFTQPVTFVGPEE